MPSPSPLPPGPRQISLLNIRNDPALMLKVVAEHGDVVRLRLAGQDSYLINHPDDIRDILVTNATNFTKGRVLQRARVFLGNGLLTSEGEVHRRQRRLMQPVFHRQRVARYGADMVTAAERVDQRWTDGATIDVAEAMMRLTLDIVGRTLFDADVEDDANEVGRALGEMIAYFPLLLLPFAEILQTLPLGPGRRVQRAGRALDDIVLRLIADRRAHPNPERQDLLSLLLLAQDDDGGGMSDQQVRDEAMTIFLAGHETTANALTWTWFLLSQHPRAEARLHAELAAVLAGRPPTLADLDHLPYTRMVFSEALRLYPPAWIIGRMAIAPFTVGAYTLPAGATLLLSPWATHRDARWFPDPERFDPDRWAPEAQAARPKFAYFPFGGGPRVCIGEPFAWMEGVLVLATLAQHWWLRLTPGHPVALAPGITLRPKHGMRMRLERRTP